MYLEHSFGESSTSDESITYVSNKNLKMFDYLVFVDSRGLVNSDNLLNISYVWILKELFNALNLSYLILSRPKNLTVFATLFNFLNLNTDIKFTYLITNLGFVDCTPKKQENIDDILLQIKQYSKAGNTIIEHENYVLSNGVNELLQSVIYSDEYIKELNNLFNKRFEKSFFINTPIVPTGIKMDRERPNSFFNQLAKTNELIEKLVCANDKNILIDVREFNYTYDGVHYTQEGHQKIFNKIKESLKL